MSVANRSGFPCYNEDEGRSLGATFQEGASNHQKGLPSRAVVLSVLEKSGQTDR
mgnify:CR=1 FL=1